MLFERKNRWRPIEKLPKDDYKSLFLIQDADNTERILVRRATKEGWECILTGYGFKDSSLKEWFCCFYKIPPCNLEEKS